MIRIAVMVKVPDATTPPFRRQLTEHRRQLARKRSLATRNRTGLAWSRGRIQPRMRYMATIFIELRDLDVTHIAEADREVQSLMHREGFSKHGTGFPGPTNREADHLAQHLNTAVLPQLTTVGKPFAIVTHHRDV